MSEQTRRVLEQYWGYKSFRPLQEDIVDSVIAGRDTLALLPTGGGKSICFQVPAMAMNGVCIVVTPLISLMKDQVQHLKKIGIEAAAIYTGLTKREIELAYNQAVYGKLKFLYVSPERLVTNSFLMALRKMTVCLIAVDESHCISQWGYDFRPPYLKIADIRPFLPATPILALTATATSIVVNDIQFRLKFKKKNVFQTSYERKNVIYNVLHESDKYGVMFNLFDRMTSGSGIVYVRSRKRTGVIAEWLSNAGITAASYHAGLDASVRDERQRQWMDGKTKVMVATNAFGMGIDKPDVRLVVHLDLPDSLEAYFQEAGRAGRDLKHSEAYLLVSESDIKRLHDNFESTYPPLEDIKLVYNALFNYFGITVGAGEGFQAPFELDAFTQYCGFSPLKVFNILKLLEKDGIISMSEALETPSKVYITANDGEIRRFRSQYADYDMIIDNLLRSCPGICSDFTVIREEKVARMTGLDVNKVVENLKNLENYNVLIYSARCDKPQIQFLSDRVEADNHFVLSNEVYADRKKDAEMRIKAVEDFVRNSDECRSVQLLRYFGEKIDHTCGKCDVCISYSEKNISKNDFEIISHSILNKLKTNDLDMNELSKLTTDVLPEKIFEVARHMIDSGMIRLTSDGFLKMTKK